MQLGARRHLHVLRPSSPARSGEALTMDKLWHRWCEKSQGDEAALGYVVIGTLLEGEWYCSDGYLYRCPEQENQMHGTRGVFAR